MNVILLGTTDSQGNYTLTSLSSSNDTKATDPTRNSDTLSPFSFSAKTHFWTPIISEMSSSGTKERELGNYFPSNVFLSRTSIVSSTPEHRHTMTAEPHIGLTTNYRQYNNRLDKELREQAQSVMLSVVHAGTSARIT